MEDNRYSLAGWLSIVAAVVFPLAFIIDGITEIAIEVSDMEIPWGVGPADALFLLYAGIAIYVLNAFKGLMYEHYSFKEIGKIINIAILWNIVFFAGSFILELLLTTVWPQNDIGLPLVLLVFWIVGVAVFGIIDIVMAIILLRQGKRFKTSVRVFAVLSIVVGFFEATVILSPLTLLLVPASGIALAVVFLGRTEEVEFV